MKNLLFVVGSFRESSFNRQFALLVMQALSKKANVDYLYFQDLPMYISQIEYPPCPSIARIRQQFDAADGVWFFTPEYNANIPGAEKNLIDWLSRPPKPDLPWTSSSLYGKKVTCSSCAGKNGGKYALETLMTLLGFCGCKVMKEPVSSIALSAETYQSDLISDTPGLIELAKKQADAFIKFLEAVEV